MNNVFIEKKVCRHFKGGMYCTMNVSEPISEEEIENFSDDTEFFVVSDSEKFEINELGLKVHESVFIYMTEDGKCYHDESSNNCKLALYVSLENGHSYGRPLDMFLSEVDREKYPEAKQKFRMEYMTFDMKNTINENVLFGDQQATVVFGDGKVGLGRGSVTSRINGEKYALFGARELKEAMTVGALISAEEKSDRVLDEPEVLFVFKSEESLDVVLEALEDCREIFNKNTTTEE